MVIRVPIRHDHHKWTVEEIELLRVREASYREIADIVGLPQKVVAAKALSLGLLRNRDKRKFRKYQKMKGSRGRISGETRPL